MQTFTEEKSYLKTFIFACAFLFRQTTCKNQLNIGDGYLLPHWQASKHVLGYIVSTLQHFKLPKLSNFNCKLNLHNETLSFLRTNTHLKQATCPTWKSNPLNTCGVATSKINCAAPCPSEPYVRQQHIKPLRRGPPQAKGGSF